MGTINEIVDPRARIDTDDTDAWIPGSETYDTYPIPDAFPMIDGLQDKIKTCHRLYYYATGIHGFRSLNITTEPGQQTTASFYLRYPYSAIGHSGVMCGLLFLDSNGGELNTVDWVTTESYSESWVRIHTTKTAPAGSAFVSMCAASSYTQQTGGAYAELTGYQTQEGPLTDYEDDIIEGVRMLKRNGPMWWNTAAQRWKIP